jgi:endonuclease-3
LGSKQLKMQRIIELLVERYWEEEERVGGKENPFRILIGCVLSQRTREGNARRAAEALFEDVQTPGEVLRLDPEELKDKIRCSGFYNQKARNIRAICEVLTGKFDGVIPDDRATLMSLPGVGPKTADIVLSHAFGKPAIAVDVHVATVAKRLGLVDEDAKPEEVKEALEGLFPPERFRFVDSAFVRLGQERCGSRDPKCEGCFMGVVCDHSRRGDDK